MRREGRLDDAGANLAHRLASSTTRRSFIGTLGAVLLGLTADRAAAAVPGTERLPGGWYGLCGHYFTTGSCKGPYKLPRVDRLGRPVRPDDGRPVDDTGRLVDDLGRPVDEAGSLLLAADGSPLPPAPRSRLCEDGARSRYKLNDAVLQGSWYRCCNGQIRKLWDCCSVSPRRINGDVALRGYCHGRRKVFCVVYVDTGVPC